MPKPAAIGTVNGRFPCNARIGRKPFVFDATVLGLVQSARQRGAVAGSLIHADFGAGLEPYRVVAAPGDRRAGELWAVRA